MIYMAATVNFYNDSRSKGTDQSSSDDYPRFADVSESISSSDEYYFSCCEKQMFSGSE